MIDDKKIFFNDSGIILIHADCFQFMETMKLKKIDMICADPPYFLSNGGVTNSGGNLVSVDKGEWDKISSLREKYLFNKKWINLSRGLLKPDGTIWIFGSFHNIYTVGMALEEEKFRIMNNITWQKIDPPENLTHKYFTHSTETILWARKSENRSNHFFNYQKMVEINQGCQMTDVWTLNKTPRWEKKFGKHPTQKPEEVLKRIILSSTKKGDLILDPFIGSGTTAVVAKKLGRRCIGIDNNEEYLKCAAKRINAIQSVD